MEKVMASPKKPSWSSEHELPLTFDPSVIQQLAVVDPCRLLQVLPHQVPHVLRGDWCRYVFHQDLSAMPGRKGTANQNADGDFKPYDTLKLKSRLIRL